MLLPACRNDADPASPGDPAQTGDYAMQIAIQAASLIIAFVALAVLAVRPNNSRDERQG